MMRLVVHVEDGSAGRQVGIPIFDDAMLRGKASVFDHRMLEELDRLDLRIRKFRALLENAKV